jgi:molybdopterin molybdotransferase
MLFDIDADLTTTGKDICSEVAGVGRIESQRAGRIGERGFAMRAHYELDGRGIHAKVAPEQRAQCGTSQNEGAAMTVEAKPFGARRFLFRQPGERAREGVIGGIQANRPEAHVSIQACWAVHTSKGTIAVVATLTFEQARQCVLEKLRAAQPHPKVEVVGLSEGAGRVLAAPVASDRDYPALARSVRDGFAVRAADLPGDLFVIGEVRAGESFTGEVQPGEALEIMTGAPLPRGADSVVMVEHCTLSGERVTVPRTLPPGENVSPQASQAREGEVLLEAGDRLGFAEIALLATVGSKTVPVFARPQVAILATGDEIVEINETPLDYQIRNSNVESLAVQVKRAGGCPNVLPIARDLYAATRELAEHGLRFDMLLLSGGVSAGKYDIVERVLADLGAEFYFDRVLIMPGQPLVFGKARDKFFFGLPGNPASTMVTFEIFARSAVELLGGQKEAPLPLLWSKLSHDFHQKTGLTRFLPAVLSADGAQITPMSWQGSGDVPSLTRANAFMVTEPDRESWTAGDWIRVLLK